MKTLKLTSLLFAAALMLGTSCNKYENGPSLSLRTKKARLVNTWELTEVIDGDTDISEFTKGTTMTIDKEGNFSFGGKTPQGVAASGNGTWEFSSDKTTLILTTPNVRTPEKWVITKLKNDELWVEKEQSNNTKASRKFVGLD